MIQNLFRYQSMMSTAQIALITVMALTFNLWASDQLNAAYAASKFPVPYWQAQLSFDHNKLKGWYSFLIEGGTLGQYIHTQLFDFVFIASVLVLHVFALLLISRLVPASSRAWRLLVLAALLSTLAPIADAVENALSFVMLANPAGFAPSLAIAYSLAATVKFAMFTFAYLAVVAGLMAALYHWVARQRSPASRA